MSLGRYALGAACLLVVLASLVLAAVNVRRHWLADWTGAPARLAEIVIALATLVAILELLGTVGWFELAPIVAACAAAGGASLLLTPRRSASEPTPTACDRPRRGGDRGRGHRGGRRRVDRAYFAGIRRRHSHVRFGLVPPAVGRVVCPDGAHHAAALHRHRVPDGVLSGHLRDAARARDRAVQARHPVAGPEPDLGHARAVRGVVRRAGAGSGRRCDGRRSGGAGNADDELIAGGQRRQRRRRDVLPARVRGAGPRRRRTHARARPGGRGRRPGNRHQAQHGGARARARRRDGRDRAAGSPRDDRVGVARGPGARRRLLVRAQPDRGRQPAAVGEPGHPPHAGRAAAAAHRLRGGALPDELDARGRTSSSPGSPPGSLAGGR